MWSKFNARCCGEKIAINKEPSWKHNLVHEPEHFAIRTLYTAASNTSQNM
jgi:hypothetical protein